MSGYCGQGVLAAVFSFFFVMITVLLVQTMPAQAERAVDFSSPYGANAIVIKVSERQLYYTLGNGQAYSYPIAVPKSWATWYGSSQITYKRDNPMWIPTANMRARDPSLPRYMPPGPNNPLGVRAMNIGYETYRIHGTSEPESIGTAATSGCFRLYNEDILKLYGRTNIGTPVYVIY